MTVASHGRKWKKRGFFLQNNLPSHIYTGVCWETFPTRWSQVEHVSGTQFPWKYLGHPSNSSIKVGFLSPKTPQRDTGTIANPCSQLGKRRAVCPGQRLPGTCGLKAGCCG